MRIQWSPSHAVGIEEIDRQQRELFAAAQRVTGAATAPDTVLEAALRRLVDVASAQFAAEERWLREANEPSVVRHELEHRRFVADLAGIADQLARGERAAVDALAVSQFIGGWLYAHLADSDRDLARAASNARAGVKATGRASA